MKDLSNSEEFRSSFEIRETDLAGRSGTYTVNGRSVETPELMPVVNPNKMLRGAGVAPKELLEKFGFKMIITNSYIIRRSEELQARALEEGLHKLLDYPGVIMTDSGTFQSYFYGGRSGKEVDVDPLEIVRFQNSIGSDIGTILDKFTTPDRDWIGAEKDLNTTLERAAASKEANSNMELAVPVQGGRYVDLRAHSGKSVYDLGIGYAPIGGVVPIMEGYDYKLLVDVIVASKTGLGPSIPAHLFGAGHPMILPLAAALGCDLFDSASYAKFAQDDRYMTRHRTMHLKEMDNLPCSCPVCSQRGPRDLMDVNKDEREALVSRHNLWVLRDVINEIRGAIKEGTLWELVERSAMFNPSMYSAVRRLRDHGDFLEQNAPRSTRRFMSSSGLSIARPEFTRMKDALSRYEPDEPVNGTFTLTDWTITHSIRVMDRMWNHQSTSLKPYLVSPFGPVPFDLIDMYPISQSLFPPPSSIDDELGKYMRDRILEGPTLKDESIEWNGREDTDIPLEKNDQGQLNMRKIRAIIRMQFGKVDKTWTDDIIIPSNDRIQIKTSRKTRKIRNVLEEIDGENTHLLSLRAEDGLLNLRWEAARRLHESSNSPKYRVVVEEGTGEFNAKGYNVFCKFVLDADPDIRAGDDVLVVDVEDRFYAVGRASVSSRMMIEGKNGTAVKIRDGAEKQES